ncbi:ROK family protein [Acidisoma sp.]|uniref:ROK family protein n=1 Tax=Acidisoma sp. TaxID=1872115 RepID=UPI003AFFE57C
MTPPVVLAVDVGGTSFKAALIDAEGRRLLTDATSTLGALGEAAFARLDAFVGRCIEAAAASGVTPVAIGLIAPGMDESTGHVLFAANLGWRDFPLGPRLAERHALPVASGHDVRTAGLAEALLGAARGFPDSVMVMIGTGIAASVVTHGQAVAGAKGMAGELGHAPVFPGGELCACGQIGCLETYASAAAIARRYRALGGEGSLVAGDIADRLGSDPIAARAWDDAVQALSIALTTVTMLLDPAVIVIGGGLAEAGEILLDPLRLALSQRLAWRPPPPILRSTLGGGGALLGAAILAFRRLGLSDLAPGWNAA